jgi:hypothetical protein
MGNKYAQKNPEMETFHNAKLVCSRYLLFSEVFFTRLHVPISDLKTSIAAKGQRVDRLGGQKGTRQCDLQQPPALKHLCSVEDRGCCLWSVEPPQASSPGFAAAETTKCQLPQGTAFIS